MLDSHELNLKKFNAIREQVDRRSWVVEQGAEIHRRGQVGQGECLWDETFWIQAARGESDGAIWARSSCKGELSSATQITGEEAI